MSENNDSLGLVKATLGLGIPLYIIVGIVRLFEANPHIVGAIFLLIPFGILAYAAGRTALRKTSIVALAIYFPVFLYLWGVPYLYTPLWDLNDQLKHAGGYSSYFEKVSSLENAIADDKKSIPYEKLAVKRSRQAVKDYPKSLGHKEDLKRLKNDLRESKIRLKENQEVLKKAKFRVEEREKFREFAKNELKGRFSEFNREMLFVLFGFLGLILFFYWCGTKVRSRGIMVITKLLSKLLIPPHYLAKLIWKETVVIPEGVAFSDESDAGFLTDANLALHTQVVGGSGSGKSNFLKTLIQDRVAKNHGVIFLDFKADFEVQGWLQGLCAYCNRSDLRITSLSEPNKSTPYNPIGSGTPTEITSQLMNSFQWSEEFYKNFTEDVILTSMYLLCHLRDGNGYQFHLGHLLRLLTDSEYRYNLLSLMGNSSLKPEISKLFMELDDKKASEKISGFVVQLRKLIFSEVGPLFTSRVESEGGLTMEHPLRSGEVLYMCMNSLRLKEIASVSGKMILQDLMKGVGKLYDNGEKTKVTLVIDEFASFATSDFIHFLDKARGAGVEIVIAHQSMADLREISENFGMRVLENTASKVIFNTLSSDDAEMFASMVGTEESVEETSQTERGFLGFGRRETGMGTQKIVEKFLIHPNTFKHLGVGEAVVSASKVDQHFGVVKIKRAYDFDSRLWDEKFASLKNQNMNEVNSFLPSSFGDLPEFTKKINSDSGLSDGVEMI